LQKFSHFIHCNDIVINGKMKYNGKAGVNCQKNENNKDGRAEC
jgi:hypothetical protein